MTPLQVIMLAHKMRQAQKAMRIAWSAGEAVDPPLMERHSVMVELEDKLDTAIQPYVDYYRNTQEADHDC